MKTSLALVVAVLTMGSYAARQGVLVGNDYTVTVQEGVDVTINSDDIAVLDGTSAKLIKMGKGRFIMDQSLGSDAALGGWNGDLEIREGYVLCKVTASTSKPLGNPTAVDVSGGTGGKVFISSGATLEFQSSSSAETNHGKSIDFAGNGVDGNGAIYGVNDNGTILGYGFCASATFTMTGDAKVGYWGSDSTIPGVFTGPRNGTLNMNGHTLSVCSPRSKNSNFKGMNVTNPGHIVLEENTKFRVENNTKLNGSSANTLTLKSGATWEQCVRSDYRNTQWKLIAVGDSTLSFYESNGGALGWYGPIELDAGLTLSIRNGESAQIRDAISGTGALKLTGSGTISFVTDLAAARANAFTGGLSVGSGVTLKAVVPAQLPSAPGAITVAEGGHLLLEPAKQDDLAAYTEPALLGLSTALGNTAYGADVQIAVKEGLDGFDSYRFTSAIAGTATFVNILGNDIVVTNASPVSADVSFRFGPGTKNVLETTGSTDGFLEVNGAEVEIPSGAEVTFSKQNAFVAGTYPAVGRLTVNGTLNLPTANGVISASSLTNSAPAKSRGLVEVGAGGVINGNIGMNRGSLPSLTSQGTYAIRGSVVTPSAEAFLGDFRSEYVEVGDGGSVDFHSLRVARGNASYDSYCNLRIKAGGRVSGGGSGTSTHSFCYNGGHADVLIDGGVYSTVDTTVMLCQDDQKLHNSHACAAFTVSDGGLAKIDYKTYEWCGFEVCNQDNSRATVNLIDGGSIVASALTKCVTHSGDTLQNHRVIVNFDGGRYGLRAVKTYANGKIFANFSQESGDPLLDDHVFVYSKGATISNDVPMSIGFPLEMPSGYGIESIALPSEIANLSAWEYSGAPRVEISDATGYGATAVALFDTETGRVTGIKVTSRGVDYTAPTVTVTCGGSDSQSRVYTDICTLTENLSDDLPAGAFTKLGTAVLTVDERCTFSGNTVIGGGTLKLGCDYALASPQVIVKKGGKLDLNGRELMSQVVCELGGSVTGDLTLSGALNVRAADLIAGTKSKITGRLTFAEGATIDLDDDNELVAGTRYVIADYGSAEGPLPTFTVSGSESQIWRLVKLNGNQLVLIDTNYFFVDGTGEAFTNYANVSNYLETCSLAGEVSISLFGKRPMPNNTKPNGNNAAITKVVFHGGNEGRVDQLDFGYYQRVFPLDITYRNLRCTYESANNQAPAMRFTPNGHSEIDSEGVKTWVIDEPLTPDHEFVFDDCLINQGGIAVENSIANAFIVSNCTLAADAENQWQAGLRVFRFDNANPNIRRIRFENNTFDGYDSYALGFESNHPKDCSIEIVGNTFLGGGAVNGGSILVAWAKRLIVERNTFYGREDGYAAIVFMNMYLGSSEIVVYGNIFDGSLKSAFGSFDGNRVPRSFYIGGNTVADGVSKDKSWFGGVERDVFPANTTWSDYEDLPGAVTTYANWPDETPFVNAAGAYSADLADFVAEAEFYAKPGVTPDAAAVPGGYKLAAVPEHGRIAWRLVKKAPTVLLIK